MSARGGCAPGCLSPDPIGVAFTDTVRVRGGCTSAWLSPGTGVAGFTDPVGARVGCAPAFLRAGHPARTRIEARPRSEEE